MLSADYKSSEPSRFLLLLLVLPLTLLQPLNLLWFSSDFCLLTPGFLAFLNQKVTKES